MMEYAIVGLILLGALIYVGWRFRKVVTGRNSCGCASPPRSGNKVRPALHETKGDHGLGTPPCCKGCGGCGGRSSSVWPERK